MGCLGYVMVINNPFGFWGCTTHQTSGRVMTRRLHISSGDCVWKSKTGISSSSGFNSHLLVPIHSMYAIYANQLTPQTTPTDRHIYHTWSVWGWFLRESTPPRSLFPTTPVESIGHFSICGYSVHRGSHDFKTDQLLSRPSLWGRGGVFVQNSACCFACFDVCCV